MVLPGRLSRRLLVVNVSYCLNCGLLSSVCLISWGWSRQIHDKYGTWYLGHLCEERGKRRSEPFECMKSHPLGQIFLFLLGLLYEKDRAPNYHLSNR